MGLISYHRAGVAKRQARTVLEFAQTIAATVEELVARQGSLDDVVDEYAAAIDELRTELDELRQRLDRITPSA